MQSTWQVWKITHGKTTRIFYTAYLADQYARALRLNGTGFTMEASVQVSGVAKVHAA